MRSWSTSKLSLIRVPIHIHNWRVSPTIGSSFPIAERKLKRRANDDRLGCAQSSILILFFFPSEKNHLVQ